LAGLQRTLATLYSKTGGDVMSAEEKQLRKEMAKWQLDADYIDVSSAATAVRWDCAHAKCSCQ
jgi:hypothetical protein